MFGLLKEAKLIEWSNAFRQSIRSASISGLGYYDYMFFESLMGMGVVLLLLVFPQLTLTA